MFSAKLGELIPVLVWALAGLSIGVLVGSLINALWLRLASSWLRIGAFGFGQAFGTAFLCTFVFTAFASLMILPVLLGAGRSGSPLELLSPFTFVELLTSSVLGHALIFSHRLADADGEPLRFGRASTLALVYLGICSAFSVVVWLLLGTLSAAWFRG